MMIYHDIGQIAGPYDHIYLSPHIDDAALSCGGQIAAQRAAGQRVLVVTVCSAAPPADADFSSLALAFHRDWGLAPAEVVAARLEEDRAAMALLDADGLWAGRLDAIYRDPRAYHSRETLFAAPAPGDPLPGDMAGLVAELRRRCPRALLYAPLGVGEHVDHQACCAAALAAGPGALLYEDFPYVARPGLLERRLAQIGRPLRPEPATIDAGLERKVAAVLAYASQLAELAQSQLGRPAGAAAPEVMADAIRAYARTVAPPGAGYGERFWAAD